ncbi:Uncharacterised protein [Chlamydia trachomatis]|nr:Uncharacterised protein [Chlamydia trachomatis]
MLPELLGVTVNFPISVPPNKVSMLLGVNNPLH